MIRSKDIFLQDQELAALAPNCEEASMFNHNSIGKQEKPLIGNAQFKFICDQIKSGNIEIIDRVKTMYTFVQAQTNLIDKLKSEYEKLHTA